MEVEYTDSNSSEFKKSESNFETSDVNNMFETNSKNVITLGSNKSAKFDHFKKMEIKKKIEKIKKKEYLIDIFKILTSQTSNGDYSENNNGIFIFFHDLPDEIYEKVDNYVNNIYRMHKTNINSNNIFNSEISENLTETSDKNIDKHLTNKEKMIFRRKKYEEYLSHNQE
jgi:hypothetical protein